MSNPLNAQQCPFGSWRKPAFVSVIVLCAAPVFFLPVQLREWRTQRVELPLEPEQPSTWLAGRRDVVAYDMPAVPFPEQRRPGCGTGQVVINGGCWIELAERPIGNPPRCNEGAAWNGRCWLPVHKSNAPLTSVQRAAQSG
jgi:hypothetical protein